ncbi:MAG: hypothetical protein K5899_03655 [Bacteroidaceae bacterium]|nr:hypothetical protein [Bacteroidaceae bacterium]
MKRLYIIIMVLAMITANSYAQSLSVSNIEAQADEETELVVSLTGGTSMTALQFNLAMPEGMSLSTGGVTLGAATNGHTLNVETLDNGDHLFVLYNMDQNPFRNGELLRIPVQVGSTTATPNGKLYTVRTATADAVSHTCNDVSWEMTTNINHVSSPKTIKSIYNLAGQKTDNMQKGINIVDGKKVMVK